MCVRLSTCMHVECVFVSVMVCGGSNEKTSAVAHKGRTLFVIDTDSEQDRDKITAAVERKHRQRKPIEAETKT